MALPALFTPIQSLLAREIEYWSDEDVIMWAVGFAQKNDYWNNDVFVELVSINTKQKRNMERSHPLLQTFVEEEFPELSLDDPELVHFAKELLADRLQSYIDDKCRPYDLCKMADPLERVLDYPLWMGDLWNACDWIEPTATSSDVPYLKDSAKEILENVFID